MQRTGETNYVSNQKPQIKGRGDFYGEKQVLKKVSCMVCGSELFFLDSEFLSLK
jgi:hypothetical protein